MAVYGHESFHPPYIVYQYWLFYPYNLWADKHEGDWELIQVIADAPSRQPIQATYAWHLSASTCYWAEGFCCEGALGKTPEKCRAAGGTVEDFEIIAGTHPAVYPGFGSHGSFSTEGAHTWRQNITWLAPGCSDWTDMNIPDVRLVPRRLSLAPGDVPNHLADLPEKSYDLRPVGTSTPWIRWSGWWGDGSTSPRVPISSGRTLARPVHVGRTTPRSKWPTA